MQKINELIDAMKNEIVSATQEIVKIKSVEEEPGAGMPFGRGVNDALNYALKLSESLGFKTMNIDGYMGFAEYGEGADIVGVLGHLDVVPEGNGWKYPPYGAEIHDGKIYGRGTTDDKGPIIAALYGLNAVKLANVPLSKRVRIFFGTNEETGSKEIPYYLAKYEAPAIGFTPDAEYPVIYAEKGIINFKAAKKFKTMEKKGVAIEYVKGGNARNMVPDYCEAVISIKSNESKNDILDEVDRFIEETRYDITYDCEGSRIILKSKGLSAHGSLPHLGKNAIMQLFMLLSRLDIADDVKQYIDFFVQWIGMETNGKTLGAYYKDETGELTLNIGVADISCNNASLYFNIRFPVTYKADDLKHNIIQKAGSCDIDIEDFRDRSPLYFPKDHPLIRTLQKVYTEQTGRDAEPLAIGGSTYAKSMPNIVAFGPIFPGKPDVDHQTDEYIEIDDLILNAKIYGNAILELAK